jgi:hypothetical protein
MSLGETDGKDPPRFRDRFPDLVELGEGGNARLVAHHVLARFHRPNCDTSAIARMAAVQMTSILSSASNVSRSIWGTSG